MTGKLSSLLQCAQERGFYWLPFHSVSHSWEGRAICYKIGMAASEQNGLGL